MQKTKVLRHVVVSVVVGLPLLLSPQVFADAGSVGQVQSFIQSVLKVMASLAGLVAAGFFMLGGYQYITSSGSPDHMDRAKRTLWHSAIGLSIVIAAFVIANIVTDLATKAFGS